MSQKHLNAMRLLNRHVRMIVSLQLWLNKLDDIPQVLKKTA